MIDTFEDLAPAELWITHGREEGLCRWAELNGCETRASLETGENADVATYAGCRAGTSVVSYVIASADHAWPARTVRFRLASNGDKAIREVDATDRMWEFFKASGGEMIAKVAIENACGDKQKTAAISDGGQGTKCSPSSNPDSNAPLVSDDL